MIPIRRSSMPFFAMDLESQTQNMKPSRLLKQSLTIGKTSSVNFQTDLSWKYVLCTLEAEIDNIGEGNLPPIFYGQDFRQTI